MKDFKLQDWVTYVPSWLGNREDDNPITVEIHPLTMRESSSYAEMIVSTPRAGFRSQMKDNSVKVFRRQFIDNVRNIKNLSLNGRPITSGEELWDSPFTDLITEIAEAMNSISTLTEGMVKNSASQPGGSLKARAGTAKTAKGEA